jgi:hypothetical protein
MLIMYVIAGRRSEQLQNNGYGTSDFRRREGYPKV